MSLRNRITQVLLWLSILTMSIWVGGTVYQMVVVVPQWSASPPESVRTFFLGTQYNEMIRNFFGPRMMPFRVLPVLGVLLSGWNLKRHRKYFLLMAVCMAAGVLLTFGYIYPINDVLFTQAGGEQSADEIRSMVSRWIFADHVRLAIMSVGFLGLLRALSIPLPTSEAS